MINRPVNCARCNRRLKEGHWVYSKFTRPRYCYPGEGCQKKKGIVRV